MYGKKVSLKPGHVEGAVNVVLQNLDEQLVRLENPDENLYLHCQSGYRSMIAASLMKAKRVHPALRMY
jgi:rhodanese-related sulfurtransferase